MSLETPYISVIVPVYNGEKTLDFCLNSLLSQDYPPERYEIIVVNNKSTDHTAEIIKKYPVRVLEENTIQSSYSARNKGVKYAKGSILAFTDADCCASSRWLCEGSIGFDDSNIGGVAGAIMPAHSDNPISQYLTMRKILSQDATMNNPFLPYAQTANVFYRKDVFDRIGFFEHWESGGDADFSWRMQLEGTYSMLLSHAAYIEHFHRTTLFGLFKLFKKNGIGASFIYKKYRDVLPQRYFRQTMQDLWYLFKYLIPHTIWANFRKGNTLHRKYRYYDLVAFLGHKIGMMEGSITNKVYYL